ncbi:hypothetical protein RclHR1_39640001, partial [Rhizophagus clarus]
MPDLKEPSQHKINNYLYLIINQLNHLWNGYFIKTNEHNNGRFVRGAIIGCSSDVPASQKLCSFISACIACYRYYKSANFINNQPNFGRFADLNDWFIERDINEIREKASSYNNSRCNIKPKLLRIISKNTILQYFLSNCDNDHLFSSLEIIEPRKSVGSLAALDDFASDEYQNFIRLSLIEEDLAYRTEYFPGLLMKPCKETTLPNQILDLLVEFYNSLYN